MSNQEFTENASENPLADFSDYQDLSELFERDPLKLSDRDLDAIVHEMREHRKRWMQEESKAKKSGTKQNHKKTKNTPSLKDLDLDNIQL